jgi:pterin-4a-carbinolamine dehydratase
MKRIKRFNESVTVNPINSLENEILDILQDSFLDETIPVEVGFSPAYMTEGTIKKRESVYVTIGNQDSSAARPRKASEYISLKDKMDDLKRLVSWAKTENLYFEEIKIYGVLNVESGYVNNRQIVIKDIDTFDPDHMKYVGIGISGQYPNSSEKFGSIELSLVNYGWQTSHSLNYGGSISKEILQEYYFEDMNKMTHFISGAMGVFESQDHHPHYFNWSGKKLLISLTTHSSGGVTQKDWDVVTQLNTLLKD